MALDRAVLERQLAGIRSKLTACEQALTSAGIQQDNFAQQPSWRQIDADRRQVTRRLRAAAKIEQREQQAESES